MAMSPEVPERERRTIAIRKVGQADTIVAAAPVACSRAGTTAPGPPRSESAPPVAKALPPGSRIGQYELVRLLGRGGMGEVYLAHDLRLGRLVAIKFLAEHGAGVTERFLTEARATARCNHENIVVIHEVGEAGEHGGHPYMVLEYLEGQTLRQWLREHAAAAGEQAPVPPGLAVELMLPVVRALAYAHERGIVHRDLKPENVMLTRFGTIKVLDFGIAKLLSWRRHDREDRDGIPDGAFDLIAGRVSGPGPCRGSALIGTLPYMSPEQMNQGVTDHRSDLWTVGIMLFELVTGRHPVSSHDMGDLLRIADEDAPMLSMRELMPDIGPLGAVIDRCLIKDPADRTSSACLLVAELEELAPSRRAVVVGDDGNPFVGLAAFQEADADRFFGRDREIAHIAAELRSRSLVAVVGSSGVGKSSVIRAGVIPALKRSGEGWDTYVLRPGREPLAALAGVIAQITDTACSAGNNTNSELALPALATLPEFPMQERLCAEPGHLRMQLRARASSKLRRILIFVDQLEELYTLGTPPDERAAFLACLAAVADDASSPLRVIVTMRSDFFHRLAEDWHFSHEIIRGLVRLPPMRREGLCKALIHPVESCEFRFAPSALVDRMVDALDGTPGALPLLQFTAARLWELRDRNQRLLTEASYGQLGGVAGALASHADTVLAGMPARDARLARVAFLRMVTPERTRALATLSELRHLGPSPGDMDRVVTRLIDARLFAVALNAKGPGRTISLDRDDGVVEIVHDSLIHTWPLLARWLDESGDDATMLARLRSAARHWERSGHAAGLLWSGEAAIEAHAWHQRYRGGLAPVEQRYLVAMLAATQRVRLVQRPLFGRPLLMSVVTAMAIGLPTGAWQAWQAKDRQAAPTTQFALRHKSEDTSVPPPGVELLLLHGHDDSVMTASFSSDGTRIVSASMDQTVRVWNADGYGEPVVLRGHDHWVRSASFSPDGTRIVSGSLDKTVRVWRADGSGEPVVLRGHEGGVESASFSPDGTRIVSGSLDKTVRVWRADGSGEPVVLRGHEHGVSSASFSPDGTRIVSASLDKTVRVWWADGSGEPVVLRGHEDGVESASFSPDGTRIVSASLDKTVRVWRADGSGKPVVLRGHHHWVSSTSFSPDGQYVISASSDSTTRIWRLDDTGEPLILTGNPLPVSDARFSPDGLSIVSASEHTVRVWRDFALDTPGLRGRAP